MHKEIPMTRRPSGGIRFTVALVSDTHVNEREDFSASPYPANAEANARARHVFAQIARSGAAFSIHLGDMVNPVPELPSFAPSVECFNELARILPMPLHLMPGNHDIGDKPVAWMPAGTIDAHHIAQYRAAFGPDRQSFDHGDCHFVMINSPLINSGLPEEAEHADWLEADLAAASAAGKRIFLLSHYPLYVSDPAEPGSYDNIDEPGRGWLIGLVRKYRPEALFCGHVHNFWYDRIGETEVYVVPSTCFVRHDYSEMYRIDGGSQKGRNDAAKLGHITLEIHGSGHVAHYHRSYGANLDPDGRPAVTSPSPRPHVKTTALDKVFVDMRHAWAEEMVVAPSGAVDEFARKRARNDYPLMGLWEMGLRGLRVPIQDLADPRTRRRMEIMADVGHLFHVYRYGLPDTAETALLTAHAWLVLRLELVLGWDEIDGHLPAIAALRKATTVPVTLSRVNRKDAAKTAGGRFNHLISHGFTLEEAEELGIFLRRNPSSVDGILFTIPRSVAPWTAARTLAAFGKDLGIQPVLYVKSTEASPALSFDDDVANARRFAEAVMAGAGHGIAVILDTFDDADRGYFSRTGLLDRRFNPRLAGVLLAELIRRIDSNDWKPASGDAPVLVDPEGARLVVCDAAEVPPDAAWIGPVSGESGNDDPAISVALLVVELPSR
jgi:hypothetical protein